MYAALKVLLGPALRWWCRMRVVGLEHVPRTGPFILAGNHLAALDSFCLCAVVPRPLSFIAKSDVLPGRPGVNRVISRLLRAAGQIPVDRDDPVQAASALEGARDVLAAGGVWAIHPEGTRSPDGRLYRGRTGIARVALSHPVPIVPVAVSGTAGDDRRRRPTVTVTFGPAIDALPPASAGGRQDARELTDAVMRAIQSLSGQEYTDTFAPRRPR